MWGERESERERGGENEKGEREREGERERGGERERERERGGRERERERTNDFFLLTRVRNKYNILFFIQPLGKTKTKYNNKKPIENKIIINSKAHINY